MYEWGCRVLNIFSCFSEYVIKFHSKKNGAVEEFDLLAYSNVYFSLNLKGKKPPKIGSHFET